MMDTLIPVFPKVRVGMSPDFGFGGCAKAPVAPRPVKAPPTNTLRFIADLLTIHKVSHLRYGRIRLDYLKGDFMRTLLLCAALIAPAFSQTATERAAIERA